MKKETLHTICMGGILAALYIILTAINPFGYGIIQLRVSAVISMIPFFRKEYRLACIAAVAIANMFSPLGFIDVAVGIVLWSLVYFVIDNLVDGIYLKCLCAAVLSGVLIGFELSLILHVPFLFNFVSVTISQAIVFFIGTFFLRRLMRTRAL